MNIESNYSLLHHNTFGIDVNADYFVEYNSVDDLKQTLIYCHNHIPDKKILHIGGGSNLLFVNDYHGVILHSSIVGIEPISFSAEEEMVRVGAGVVWDDFVAYCVNHGLCGVENLSIIPGEVGSSAIQNIGAYGMEAKDTIFKVETVEIGTGKDVTFSNSDCQYAYRDSIFKHAYKGQYIVTYVTFRLKRHFEPKLDYGNIRAELEKPIYKGKLDLSTLRNAIINIRTEKLPDPAIIGNAGSFFMNPIVNSDTFNTLLKKYPNIPHYCMPDGGIKIPAGWLIDQCGWKGKSLGRAGVYEKQALVLVNKGGAEGKDIVNLSDRIRSDVKEKFLIDIHPEVNFI